MKIKKKLPEPYELVRTYPSKVIYTDSLKRCNEMIKRAKNLDSILQPTKKSSILPELKATSNPGR